MKFIGWLLLVFAALTFWIPLIGLLSFPCALIGALLLIAAAIAGKRRERREEEAAYGGGVSNSAFGR